MATREGLVRAKFARTHRIAALGCIGCAIAVGCSSEPPRPPPLDPLPPPMPADTERFADSQRCGQCHTASDAALRDRGGHDVSPVLLWRSSMMALAARDPYYLATVAEERARDPGNAAEIDAACTRCHAPAGNEEVDRDLSFDALVAGTDTAAVLGRDGVTCTLCHQISPDGLGEERSFTGGFSVDFSRAIYGPHGFPTTGPMQMFVDYTPTQGDHVASAALCATCHTVVIGDVVEQATFLEWRSSSLSPGKPCQTCHVPPEDDLGQAITTAIAKFPAGLVPRMPVGRHLFVGGNAYMLRLFAAAESWANTGLDPAELEAAALAAEAHLATAAKLTTTASRDGGTAILAVKVENQTGHKLPTGYPSRRMWLHVTVREGDAVVFESGAPRADGSLAGDGDAIRPHLDTIERGADVQVWQAVLVDRAGEPTHRALDAARYGKDDRILPAGFAPTGGDVMRTASVGVAADTSFVPGSDTVTYRIPAAAGATVSIELLYESLTPGNIDALDAGRTPAGTRFVDLARAQPIVPIVMARAEATLP